MHAPNAPAAGDRVSCLLRLQRSSRPGVRIDRDAPRRCVGPAATRWCDLAVGGGRRARDAPITSRLFGPATGACGRRGIGGPRWRTMSTISMVSIRYTDRGDPEVACPSGLRRAGNGNPFVRHLDLVHATGAARPDSAPRPCPYKPAKLVARQSPTIRDHGSLRRECRTGGHPHRPHRPFAPHPHSPEALGGLSSGGCPTT